MSTNIFLIQKKINIHYVQYACNLYSKYKKKWSARALNTIIPKQLTHIAEGIFLKLDT